MLKGYSSQPCAIVTVVAQPELLFFRLFAKVNAEKYAKR